MTTYPAAVLADMPTIYWRLGEASGTAVADSSGNGHDGTYLNAPTLGVTGLQTSDGDTAIHCTRASSQSAKSTETNFNGPYGAYTLEVLFRIDTIPADALYSHVWGIDSSDGGFLALEVEHATSLLMFFDNTGDLPRAPITAGTIYHAVGTDDGTTMKLYLNGVLVDSRASGGGDTFTGVNPFEAGNDDFGEAFDGTIDECAFYTHALSAARVLAHYNALAGSLTLTPYSFVIRSTTFGNGTNFSIGPAGIEGLGVPDAKSQDVVYNGRDGSYANPDYTQPRVVTIPVIIRAASATAALADLTTLETAWAVSATDIPLTFDLPGWEDFTMNGRPRSLKADLGLVRFGVIHALLRFDCPTPTITYL